MRVLKFVVLKDWIDGIVNGRLKYHSAAGREWDERCSWTGV